MTQANKLLFNGLYKHSNNKLPISRHVSLKLCKIEDMQGKKGNKLFQVFTKYYLTIFGVFPVHRLKARLKTAGSV